MPIPQFFTPKAIMEFLTAYSHKQPVSTGLLEINEYRFADQRLYLFQHKLVLVGFQINPLYLTLTFGTAIANKKESLLTDNLFDLRTTIIPTGGVYHLELKATI